MPASLNVIAISKFTPKFLPAPSIVFQMEVAEVVSSIERVDNMQDKWQNKGTRRSNLQ